MTIKPFHPDLTEAQALVYEPNRLILTDYVKEIESSEYAACSFDLNNQHVKFRVAKITPKKLGFFVTLWKRIGNGPILPFDQLDPIDLFIISVRDADHFGQFIFPKNVLSAKGVLSKGGKGGKRAMRVYPPWVTVHSAQAKRSQRWQCQYFIEIQSHISNQTLKQVSKLICSAST